MASFVSVVSTVPQDQTTVDRLVEVTLTCHRERCLNVVPFATRHEQEDPGSFAAHLFCALRDRGTPFMLFDTERPPRGLAEKCRFALNVAENTGYQLVLVTTYQDLFVVGSTCRGLLGAEAFRCKRTAGAVRFAYFNPITGRVCVV